MKYIIFFILFLITGSKGVAQSRQVNEFRVQAWSAQKDNHLVLYWKTGSDTVEIIEPLQVHYIKVGNEVYQLVEHPTTIEKAPQTMRLGATTLWPQGSLYNYGPSNLTLPIIQ